MMTDEELDKQLHEMVSSMTVDQLIHEIELFALVDQDSTDFRNELRRRCEPSPIVKAMKGYDRKIQHTDFTLHDDDKKENYLYWSRLQSKWFVSCNGKENYYATEQEAIAALLG
jgi:hypothetical protein